MDKSFQAGWDSALGAVEKVLKSELFRDAINEFVREPGLEDVVDKIRDHLASLKCGADKEPNPELVNALRAYMSDAEAAPEWFKQLHKCSAAQSTSKWLRDLRDKANTTRARLKR